jgi:murein DD-endopeptidase MepM/ murein hydrolase activator NlpD
MIMRERFGLLLSRSVPRFVIVCALGGASGACSTDALRFDDNPFKNPFSSSSSETTGSVAPAPLKAPVSPVQAQPLGSPVSSAPLPPPQAAAAVRAPAVAAAAPLSGPAAPAVKGWSAQGGTAVALGQGESLTTLSNRYGVPEQALRSANGLPAKGQPAAGTRIVIPVYNAVGAAEAAPAPAAQPAAPAVAQAATSSHRMQLVKGAQAASAQPVQAPVKPAAPAPVAAAAPKAAAAPVKAAAAAPAPAPVKPTVVAAAPVKAAPAAAAPKAAAQPAPVAAAPAPEPVKVASAPAAQPVKAPAAPAAEAVDTTASVAAATRSTGSTEFRWPAKGRVIAGFGGKAGGNDGINIALPEGTPVKAAEGGTVAYAGNELKGYGNLVLIRHPDGWVSAYAHNGDLKVKRGEQVARGQTIATSGQTGNVSSPQLHFELRKGSTPVDPMPHLSGL